MAAVVQFRFSFFFVRTVLFISRTDQSGDGRHDLEAALLGFDAVQPRCGGREGASGIQKHQEVRGLLLYRLVCGEAVGMIVEI